MRCIRHELKKINIIKFIVALLIFLTVGNIAIGFLYNEKQFSSQKALMQERNIYVEAKENIDQEDSYGIEDICDEEIAKIDYCMDNDIPYKQLSVASNLVKNGLFVSIITIFIMMIVYNIVAVEDENNTWKNLLIINKINYKRIHVRKKIAGFLAALGIVIIFIGFVLLFGTIRYHSWGNVNLLYQDGKIVLGKYNNEIINMIICLIVKGIVYSSIAFLIACMTKKSRIAIVIPIVLLMFESTIKSVLEQFKISNILPFKYMNILENVSSFGMKEIVLAMIYMLVLLICMDIGSYYAIRNKQ